MSESTLDMLTNYVDNIAAKIEHYARQIESGDYGNRWIVTNYSADEVIDVEVIAVSEDEALAIASDKLGVEGVDNLGAERDEFDEPTVADRHGNETPIGEWPLEVVVKVGRPLAVVIATGGPHIEIEQDLSAGDARLVGYWAGETVYQYGDEFQIVLNYLTEPIWDEIPDEYK